MCNHAHLIAYVQGVWLVEPEVSNSYSQWTRSQAGREGPDHTHTSTKLCLKDHLSQSNIHRPPEANQKSTISQKNMQPSPHQNALSGFTETFPLNHTQGGSPHCLGGWTITTSTTICIFTVTILPLAKMGTRLHLPHYTARLSPLTS